MKKTSAERYTKIANHRPIKPQNGMQCLVSGCVYFSGNSTPGKRIYWHGWVGGLNALFGFECFSQHGVPRVHERCISLIQFVQHHSHPELRLSDPESVSLGESTWERAILPFPSISIDSLFLHQDFATFQKFQIVRIAMTCNGNFIFFIPLDTREDRPGPTE